MKAFKAYDIRGVYNKDFNKDDVYKIGFFLPALLETDKILVGRDVRKTSNEVFEYLAKGINDAGADVYNIGLSTTPMIYFSTAKHGFHGSVQITASHNPKEYNGLKISKTNALPVGYETGLNKLEQMIENNNIVPCHKKGKIVDFAAREVYIDFLKSYLQNYSGLKIGIDCSNGMAALLIKEVMGNKPFYIFDELDGIFPNHEPNPLVESNVKDLKNLVKKEKLDIGIIFDGDADRVMFVDENAEFIPPDLIIAVLGHYFLANETGHVLQDIRTSKAVKEYLAKFNATMHTWKVGHAFAKYKLKEINGIYGGELAGHYYYRDFYYCDSGILTAIIVLNVMKKMQQQGKTFSQLIKEIKAYHNSGEINFKIKDKHAAMEEVKEHFINKEKPENFFDFDGYRVEYPGWWFNIRPSNTEPYLRLVAEAKNKELLEEKLSEIKGIIEKFE